MTHYIPDPYNRFIYRTPSYGAFTVGPILPTCAGLADEPTDLNWLPALYISGPGKASTDLLSRLIISLSQLLAADAFDLVSIIIRSIEISKISPEAMIALARTTFTRRDRILEWKSFVLKTVSELDNRGFDGAQLTAGLLR